MKYEIMPNKEPEMQPGTEPAAEPEMDPEAMHETEPDSYPYKEIENGLQFRSNGSDEFLNEDIPNDYYYARKTKISLIEGDTLSKYDGTDDIEDMNSATISSDIGTIEEEPEEKG